MAGAGWNIAMEDSDDEDGAGIEESALMEVMKRLEAEITGVDSDVADGRGCSPLVTINGNEESCGPSFSDSSSTVMASLDVAGAGGTIPGEVELSPVETGNESSWLARAEGIFWPACDVAGDDEEWLERVLNSTGPGMELAAAYEEELPSPCLE